MSKVSSAVSITHFLAKGISETKVDGKSVTSSIKPVELAESISEIEIQTEIKGANFIKVHISDPYWTVAASGLCTPNSEGLLPQVAVEFPEETGWTWVLTAAELTNELNLPNLVLTFEDRIAWTLRQIWGPKRAKPGTLVRAKFIAGLVEEVTLHGYEEIRLHIPILHEAAKLYHENQVLQRELAIISNTAARTKKSEEAAKRRYNKSSGISPAAPNLQVKGAPATEQQKAVANELLEVCVELKAKPIVSEAILCAATGESDMGKVAGTENSLGFWGILQGSGPGAPAKSNHPNYWPKGPQETKAMAEAFIKGGKGFVSAEKLAEEGKSVGEIATLAEGSGEQASFYGQYQSEAKAFISAFGEGKIAGATGGGAQANSQTGEITRGTTEAPSETSFDCIQRLAGKVNWAAFNGNETFYYMSGPELAEQEPQAYLEAAPGDNKVYFTNGAGGVRATETGLIQVPLVATWDNSTLEYETDHKVHGRVQRRSRITKPQSPAEIRLNLVCNPTEFQAGMVFYFVNSGPLNGRWIITDATRNYIKDKYTQFILQPPTAPIAENAAGKPNPTPTVQPTTAEGYVNPLKETKSLTPERIDQGVDYSMQVGSPLLAIGNQEVAGIIKNWYNEQPLIFYKLLEGRQRNHYYYISEQINVGGKEKEAITVTVGQKFKAGQRIATYAREGTGIETGWCTSTGETLAMANGGYIEGYSTAAGESFSRFLEALGASGGVRQERSMGSVPPGYP